MATQPRTREAGERELEDVLAGLAEVLTGGGQPTLEPRPTPELGAETEDVALRRAAVVGEVRASQIVRPITPGILRDVDRMFGNLGAILDTRNRPLLSAQIDAAMAAVQPRDGAPVDQELLALAKQAASDLTGGEEERLAPVMLVVYCILALSGGVTVGRGLAD